MTTQPLMEIVEDLERTLLAFIRKHEINQHEYRRAIGWIIDSIKQGEETLLFDVFFEATATDIGDRGRSGSTPAIEGPFYLRGAPELSSPYVMPQRNDEHGEVLVFSGSVRSTDGTPLAGAELDMWHADADGLYSGIHPGIPEWNLRGRFRSDTEGRFEIRTILPPPYEIPKDGPTGTLLGILGRHCFRPAHLHLKVSAPGHEKLTSQLYFQGGQYLDSDVANAVRDGLIVSLTSVNQTLHASYDFVLEPRAPRASR